MMTMTGNDDDFLSGELFVLPLNASASSSLFTSDIHFSLSPPDNTDDGDDEYVINDE